MKSTAPLTSATTQPPLPLGRRSTPTSAPPVALGGSDRDRASFAGRIDGLAPAAEDDVGPPFAGSGDAPDRTRDASTRDDDADVVAVRRNQLLGDGAGRAEPASGREVGECLAELGLGLAEDDVAAPAAEARLEHDRSPQLGQLLPGRDVDRCGVRNARCAHCERGGELVVRGRERAGVVQDLDPRLGEAVERPEARLDPVERLPYVEPAEDDVAVLQARDALRRRQDAAELGVRRAGTVSHDGEGRHLRGFWVLPTGLWRCLPRPLPNRCQFVMCESAGRAA